jgi:hypothetical protein
MKTTRNLMSRKDALRRMSGLALGLPLISTSLGNTISPSFFLKGIGPLDKFPPLFPFQISHDSPDNVTNFKHLLDKPAGKRGFIRVKNGRFINDAGIIRLNGTNLTGPANFPSKKDAEQIGDRLARFGINCVRLHYMDSDYGNFLQEKEPGIIENNSDTQRNLDPKQLDRLDYLISVFKKKGIYVDMNLHVARWWDDRDGFPHQDQRPTFDKGLDNFEPRMIELQKEYARKLLTHVNPYTSLPYTDEPAIAVIELNNENSLFNQYFKGSIDKLPDPYAFEFRKQWNMWLKNKYKTTKDVREAWLPEANKNEQVKDEIEILLCNNNQIENYTIPTVKASSSVYSEVLKDFFQFLTDTEYNYCRGMFEFLKNDLKVKSLVSGTQIGYYGTPFNQSALDYIDIHAYWCHPSPVNPNWEIVNKPMVNSLSMIQFLASQRVIGKPYTVSEYNHPFPNQYGTEAQPLLRAYGRFQGWDGVFEYTYNDRTNYDPTFNNYFFSIIERTDVLAHFPACSAIFLRGDVKEGESNVVGPLDYKKYFDHLIKNKSVRAGIETSGLDIKNTLIHKTAVDLSGKLGIKMEDTEDLSKKNILVSDTDELTWNIEDPKAGYFTVNTPNTKLFTGFPKNREISFGDITLSIGKTRLGWVTISLVSQKGNGFGKKGKPDNILLTATGIIKNNGMTIIQEPNEKIKLSDWGKSPVYAEGIPATISLPVKSNRVTCFSLDTRGNRMEKIPIGKVNKDYTKITIKPQYKTVWYEILIK